MIEFFTEYGIEIVLSLLTTGLLGLCKHFYGEMKKYRRLAEQANQDEINAMIDKKLEPVVAEIEELKEHLRLDEELEEKHMLLIIEDYKQRLITMCRHLILQGYMTDDEYTQLSDLYKIYHDLGGNGQGTDYYKKARGLEVKGNDE